MSNPPTSSLLSLPTELRNQIWRLVVGDRIIRIASSGRRLYVKQTYDLGRITPNKLQSCTLIDTFRQPKAPSQQLAFPAIDFSTSLLLTNRQISHEAAPILYSTAVFASARVWILHEFVASLKFSQRSCLRSMLLFSRPWDKYGYLPDPRHGGIDRWRYINDLLPNPLARLHLHHLTITSYHYFEFNDTHHLEYERARILRDLETMKYLAVDGVLRVKSLSLMVEVQISGNPSSTSDASAGKAWNTDQAKTIMKEVEERRDEILRCGEAAAERGGT